MDRPLPSTALQRFTVLDLTRVRAGPTCVRQFGDWGANVIKIEQPPTTPDEQTDFGRRHGPDFQNLHRNKRSITLNLKEPDGLEIFNRLVAEADVVVENYRPDVKNRLGIDYESLKKINKGIILTSISGFGQDGPYVARPGVDQIAQGMTGLMSITGEPGKGPMRAGIAIDDISAGLLAAIGTMTALLEREVSGEGQWVQSSLLQAGLFILDFQGARYLMEGDIPGQAGNNHPSSVPTGVFRCNDGTINVAPTPPMWSRFCKALGKPEMETDPQFATGELRIKNRDACNAAIEEVTMTNTSDYWVERFNAGGVPSGKINNIGQAFEDPQVKHLGIAQSVNSPKLGEITLIGQAVKLSRTPSKLTVAPPEIGEHNDEILGSIGYSEAEIASFRERGVI